MERGLAASREGDRHVSEFRGLIDHLPVWACRMAPDGRFFAANAALMQLLGYPDPEALKAFDFPSRLYVSQADRRRRQAAIVAAGFLRGFETQWRRGDGGILWIREHARAIYATDGRIAYCEGFAEDIRVHRKADEELLQSRRMLAHIMDSVPQAIFWKDRGSVYLGCNAAFARIVGVARPDDVVGKTDFDFPVPRQEAEAYRADDREVIATNRPQRHIIEPVQRADGVRLWCDTTKIPLRDEQGQAHGVLGVLEDITERRQAETALRESEERFRSFVEHAVVGIYRTTPDGRVLMANRAAALLPGLTSVDEMMRENLEEWLSRRNYSRAAFKEALERDGVVNGLEGTLSSPDGTTHCVRESARAIRDGSGTLTCYEGIIEDLSAQKALEAQLRQAQKMEAIGRLAGGVAHDFNNLLTAILGYSSIIASDAGLGHPLGEHAVQIGRAAERAGELTRPLLAFSRKQVLAPKITSLNDVVSHIEKMLRRIIGEDISLVMALDTALGRAMADPGQIEQTILNLAVNSRDAMPEGGTLTIETRNVDLHKGQALEHPTLESGSYVALVVRDTGVGMDPETMSRIFEPFFTTKEDGKGTGLGLATVHGIAKQSGDNIEVRSAPGRGSTFTVYLPRVWESAAAISRPDQGVPAGRLRGTETILLIEDDRGVRGLARSLLEAQGYTILEASHAQEALDRIELHTGDLHLMITDVVMPGMSGPELAAVIAARRSGIRVLFISGYAHEHIVGRHLDVSTEAFLQKPFLPDALARKVREVLDAGST